MKIKIVSLLFLSPFFFSQNLIQVDIEGKKITDFIKVENKLGSKVYTPDSEYVSVKPVLQPFIFERKEKEIPNLLVSYTPYKKDSVIAEILYEWDVSHFEKNDHIKKPLSFNKAMIKKYQEIVNEVSKKYGKSIQEGSLEDLKLLNFENGLRRSDHWKISDHINVHSYVTLSEYYKNNGMVTIPTVHRIRMYVSNEKEEKGIGDEVLSKEKIKFFDEEFFKLASQLRARKFDESRNFLSEKIKNSATDEALDKLVENIHFNKKIEVFMTGYQRIGDGDYYPMIQYKYSDVSNPPNDIIAVIFEENGKILGIRPMKQIK
ncbi:MAG: hypothetical protein MUW56_19820 [Chryseobacterium sp.]|uniref:hypothetical protein n=1 Tax=Chryseobacterium sp. TaxID=1871047 RepID=UPI0025C08E55|nr:hypothetical protein [Chryseobacterium sp.]MCJ7935809.1 hypothetical protein [Chryseobacterium sp.]